MERFGEKISAEACSGKEISGLLIEDDDDDEEQMKGDVGMSVHEKERKQEDAYTKTQTHS